MWDLKELMGLWDLEKVLTLEDVDGVGLLCSSHHFRIQNVPVL